MTDAEELKALRRLAELEQKEKGARVSKIKADNPGEYDPESPEWQAKYGATSGMNWLDKAAANVGAGAADVLHGAKQRLADWTDDKEGSARLKAQTKEKRVLDKTLADNTRGGSALQMVGNAAALAPMALIPGGQGVVGGTLLGAGTGAASGYLQPTDEGESVAMNTAIGGTIGTVLPLALAGGKGAVNWYRGRGADKRAAQQVAEQLGEAGQPLSREAAERMAQELESGALSAPPATVQAVPGAPGVGELVAPGGQGNVAALQGQQAGRRIPLTVGAQTQNPQLARLEQASRQRNPDMWMDFDDRHARAVSDRLREATGEAGEIATRRAARHAQYNAMGEAFDRGVDPEAFRRGVQGLREANQAEMLGPEAMNDTVLAALNKIEEKLTREGVELSPAHVRQLRVELVSKLDPQNPLRAAPRDNPAIMGMRDRIDSMLDEVGGGQYSPINRAYSEASRGVDQARAAQELRNAFYDPATGGALRKARDVEGMVPVISEPALANAIPRNPMKEVRISDETRGGVDEVLEALRRQDLIMKMKKTGSAGGGSDSVQNLTALAKEAAVDEAKEGVKQSGLLGRAVVGGKETLDKIRTARRDAIVTNALQNPTEMAALLRVIETASPEVRQTLLQQLRSAGAWGRGAANVGETAGIAGATDAAVQMNTR